MLRLRLRRRKRKEGELKVLLIRSREGKRLANAETGLVDVALMEGSLLGTRIDLGGGGEVLELRWWFGEGGGEERGDGWVVEVVVDDEEV